MIDELNRETDRGVALFAASVLDDLLKDIISAYMIDSSISRELLRYPQPLSTFSARQNICFVLGLISKFEYDECTLIRKIRNEFAHVSVYSIDFNTGKIVDLCKSLLPTEPDEKELEKRPDFNRINFILSVATLHTRWKRKLAVIPKIKRVELPDNQFPAPD